MTWHKYIVSPWTMGTWTEQYYSIKWGMTFPFETWLPVINWNQKYNEKLWVKPYFYFIETS